jgi:hypothetical protein
MDLARLWIAFVAAASPVLALAESPAPARPAESAFSWFTVLCAVAVVAVLFGIFSDARRSRRVNPPR